MNIPTEIINIVNYLEPADRGLAFSAIFALVNDWDSIEELTPAAKAVVEMAKLILMPKIERRRKAAERRKARKAAAEGSATFVEETQSDEAQSNPMPLNPVNENSCSDPQESAKILAEHTNTMTKVVDLAFRTCSTKRKVDERIREQLQKRYPGLYSDIKYTRNGPVLLIPA